MAFVAEGGRPVSRPAGGPTGRPVSRPSGFQGRPAGDGVSASHGRARSPPGRPRGGSNTDTPQVSAPAVKRKPTVNFASDQEAQAISVLLFNQLDTDGDEILTSDELDTARDLMLRSHKGREGMNPDAGDMDDKIFPHLGDVDTDGDGRISREEWDSFLCSLYEVMGRRQFLKLSGTWAAGLHHKESLCRAVGPSVARALETPSLRRQESSLGEQPEVSVMGKYDMNMSMAGLRQQLKLSISRAGKSIKSRDPVMIKVYKSFRPGSKQEESAVESFVKQVTILQKLKEPFDMSLARSEVCDPRLESASPAHLFVQILDYSKDHTGGPGPDLLDALMYIITELPKYTLKDYILDSRRRREETGTHALSQATVKRLVQSILLVVAGLHFKGMVHLNLQPENFVVHGGNLKLIDTEGCESIGKSLSILDSTLSFSPCYCSPEWASFMTFDDDSSSMVASSLLDVWALGIIICELVIMEPVMGSMYQNFAQNGASEEEATMLFMEWLGCLKSMPIPKAIKQFDPELDEFLVTCALILDSKSRKNLPSCLAHCYVSGAWCQEDLEKLLPATIVTDDRGRAADDTKQIIHQGTLMKLNGQGDPKDATQWLLRDMWIASNGSLCYFSQKEGKRLVLCAASVLSRAVVSDFGGGHHTWAFRISIPAECHGEPDVCHTFACNTEDECATWRHALKYAATLHLTKVHDSCAFIVKDLRKELKVRNNRAQIDCATEGFEPFLKGKLWKLKSEGDKRCDMDWYLRDMWISKNGSLVYWSSKEDRELIYHSSADIAKASILKVDFHDTSKPFAFLIRLPPSGEVYIAPSLFAAETEIKREEWFVAFAKFAFFAETKLTRSHMGVSTPRPKTTAKAAAKPAAKPGAKPAAKPAVRSSMMRR